jgi:hypothetical protein
MEKIATDQAPLDQVVVKAAIYPSIGVARVGNSLTDWYLGPEVPDPLPLPAGSYRDKTGALKREAVRFRIYGLNAAGTVLRELTSADASITWTVQLANKKSAWYGFQLALDIPEASAPGSIPTTLRNPLVTNRAGLAITPTARTVSGVNQPEKRFDDGAFMGIPVYLGSVLTDDAGRLLVLGGHGVSASYNRRYRRDLRQQRPGELGGQGVAGGAGLGRGSAPQLRSRPQVSPYPLGFDARPRRAERLACQAGAPILHP